MRKIDSSILKKYTDGMKHCKKCDRKLPLEIFNVRMVQGKYRPFSYCKECEREINNNKYKHTCSECGKEYRSGEKDTIICKECHTSKLIQAGIEFMKNGGFSGENNPMYGVRRFGKDNPNYKPHKTDEERENGRTIEGYGIWRSSVFKRDKYVCQCCGYNKGERLVAHHLNGYSWFKEGRTDVNNGITLCETCHKEFHSIYTNFNNTKEQFEEFLNNKFNKSA